MKKEKVITGGDFLAFGLYAFAGVGMEIVLLMIEKFLFGVPISEMTEMQHIVHWVLTSIVWGIIAYGLAWYAKKNFGFNIMGEVKEIPAKNWIIALILMVVCIASNAYSWGILKIIGEFNSKGFLMFSFQYLYYVFEIFLVVSIVIYGQKAGEMWFKNKSIPWGGILVGLSWGLMHALTKGSLIIGIEAFVSGVLYGCIYLLLQKQTRYTYLLILLAFVI